MSRCKEPGIAMSPNSMPNSEFVAFYRNVQYEEVCLAIPRPRSQSSDLELAWSYKPLLYSTESQGNENFASEVVFSVMVRL